SHVLERLGRECFRVIGDRLEDHQSDACSSEELDHLRATEYTVVDDALSFRDRGTADGSGKVKLGVRIRQPSCRCHELGGASFPCNAPDVASPPRALRVLVQLGLAPTSPFGD